MMKLLTPICAAFMLSGCIVHIGGSAAHADQHSEQQLVLDAAQLTTLNANLEAGSLTIIGSPTATDIKVNADIYTFENSEYILTLDSSGDTAKLVAKTASRSGNVWVVGGQSPRINLAITVPESLILDIEDESGDINIQRMKNQIKIEDGSNGGRFNYSNIR